MSEMNKYEAMFYMDAETFCASWFFAEIVQFGVFANIFMNQVGIL